MKAKGTIFNNNYSIDEEENNFIAFMACKSIRTHLLQP